jgi:hypothetical protein
MALQKFIRTAERPDMIWMDHCWWWGRGVHIEGEQVVPQLRGCSRHNYRGGAKVVLQVEVT